MNTDSKPNPSKYNLRTDEGKMNYNKAIDEYYKQVFETNKIIDGLVMPADNLYYPNKSKSKSKKHFF